MKRLTTFICDVFGVEAREEKRREENNLKHHTNRNRGRCSLFITAIYLTYPDYRTGRQALDNSNRSMPDENRKIWNSSGRLERGSGRFSLPIGRFQQRSDTWNNPAVDFHFQSDDFIAESFAGYFPSVGSGANAEKFFNKLLYYRGKTTAVCKATEHCHSS
jgi:hypothetical protein